jgi:hypothetical protein
MHAEHGDFMAQVDKEGAYSDEVIALMRSAIETFKQTQTF